MSSFQPLVSVIIPFYNCRYVDQAINSVLKQTYPRIEVIVVNDGSTKNQHLVKKYLPRIKYIEQPNRGVAAALNMGIKNASGEYIAWLSSDDLMDVNKIQYQLKFMQERNSILSFTNFNLVNEHNHIVTHNASQNYRNELDILRAFLQQNPVNGCTVMMSKKVVDLIGYFNENLRYAQDYEFWIRVALVYPIHYYNITLTNYRVHPSMGSVLHHDDQMKEFYRIKANYTERLISLIKKKESNKYGRLSRLRRKKESNKYGHLSRLRRKKLPLL